MKYTKQMLIGLAIILVVIVIVIVKKPNSSPSHPDTITIGAVLSLTGYASADGEALKEGIEFAKEKLLEKGVTVNIIYQDDQTDSKDTVSAINFLATQNVEAILGPTWSFLGDAAAPVLERMEMVAVVPSITSEVMTEKSDYLFYGALKNSLMEEEFVKFIEEYRIKKIAFIGNDDAWTKSIIAPLEKAALATGAQIVINEEIPYGSEATSMPSVITKIKTQTPDVIIFSIFDDQGISKLVTSARQQNIFVPIVATDTSLRRVVSTGLLGNASLDQLYDVIPKTDGSFERDYEKRYGTKPHTFADRGFDATMLLVDAIQNKGDMPLDEYLRTKTNYKGYATTYVFDENGDIKGGEWILAPIK